MTFFERLESTAIRNNSLLCVGLDPRPERFPEEVQREQDPIFAFNRRIVDATRDLVCAYKPNYAFYEAHGTDGLRALRRTIEYNLGPDQFFPLGDNSPASKDGRLWENGHFVDRRYLTGKALFIYWPHSWDRPIPFFPNFRRMGFVR